MRDFLRDLRDGTLGLLGLGLFVGWIALLIKLAIEGWFIFSLILFWAPAIIYSKRLDAVSNRRRLERLKANDNDSVSLPPSSQISGTSAVETTAGCAPQVTLPPIETAHRFPYSQSRKCELSPFIPRLDQTLGQQTKVASFGWLAEVQYFANPVGQPIGSHDRDEWLEARNLGITATDAMKLVKKNGDLRKPLWSMIEQKSQQIRQPDFQSYAMRIGQEREPEISRLISEKYEIYPNRLLLVGKNRCHLATPDGIGRDGISEIKVSKFPLDQLLSKYYDQVQWQLHVTGATRSLFAVQDRESGRITTRWIEPDTARILRLVEVANFAISKIAESRPHFHLANQSLRTAYLHHRFTIQ